MSYELQSSQSIEENARRVVREQLDTALSEIDDPGVESHVTVHQVRKRCKKIRGLLRLARPHLRGIYERENAWYKMLARKLSPARDAHVILESFDDLMSRYESEIDREAFQSIRERLEKNRPRVVMDEYALDRLMSDTRSALCQGRDRIPGWKQGGESAVLDMEGLIITYARGRRELKRVLKKPSARNLHEFRKQVRYHWYHSRLLRTVWPVLMKGYIREMRFLSETLGAEHDLCLVRKAVKAEREQLPDRETVRAFLELLDRRIEELRAKTRPVVRNVFFEKPDRMAKRFSSYWSSNVGPR